MIFKKKKNDNKTVVRIEDIEKYIKAAGGEADPETVISAYMPMRRTKILAAAFLRLDKLYILLTVLIFIVMILFIAAFMQEKMGNFTINLNRLEMYRKGIAISADGEFTEPTARLIASSVQDVTNISMADLPENLDELEGDHSGRNYMAYTYYLRNAGKEDVSYVAKITLDGSSKGAEKAARVAVWRNGERMVYAAPAKDGSQEEGCENFLSDELVCTYTESDFLVGNVDKYTVAIWLEGDDPECVDTIVGGSLEFSMRIDAEMDDKTNLFVKYVQDIFDTLNQDKAISAAGNEAPSYYQRGEVTWENRRNQ